VNIVFKNQMKAINLKDFMVILKRCLMFYLVELQHTIGNFFKFYMSFMLDQYEENTYMKKYS